MVSVDGLLTVLAVVPLASLTVAVRVIGPRVQASFRRAQETLGEISSFAQENSGGIRIVKSFALEDRQITDFRQLCDLYYDRNLKTERISNWMHPIVSAVRMIAVMLLLLFGGHMILNGTLTLGKFIQFLGYQAVLIWPMISIGWVVNQVYRGVASAARLREIFAKRSEIMTPEEDFRHADFGETQQLNRLRGDIEIRNLSFAFGDRVVLENVDMKVPAGKTVAVIGRTGSGKSTLVSLIPRLFRVPDGTIFVDGVDVNRIPLPQLRGEHRFCASGDFSLLTDHL